MVYWCQIFFRKHGKATLNDRQDQRVLVIDDVILK